MSVLVRALPSRDPKLLHVYVKGAPETIQRLCLPESSECRGPGVHSILSTLYLVELTLYLLICAVPGDLIDVLTTLTQQGYRVLAMGHKTMHLPWHKAERVQR